MGCTASHRPAAPRKRLLEELDTRNGPAVAQSSTGSAELSAEGHPTLLGSQPTTLKSLSLAPRTDSQFGSLRRRSSGGNELETHVRAMRELVKICGLQTRGKCRIAALAYEMECRHFPRRSPKVAAAYARLAGELHDSERLAATAFLVGLLEGLANAQVDPTGVSKRVGAEDWHALEHAVNHFISCKAVALDGGTFEPQDPGLVKETLAEFPSTEARAQAFFEALKPLAEILLLQLKRLQRRIPEATGPSAIVRHLAKSCTPPLVSAETSAVEAFHVARKAEHELDHPAIHFLSAAWHREPRSAVQFHHVGQNLGIMCWAVVDLGVDTIRV